MLADDGGTGKCFSQVATGKYGMCRGTVEVCTGNVICGKWRKLTTSSSIYGQGLSTIYFAVGKFGMCRGTVEICTGNVIGGK